MGVDVLGGVGGVALSEDIIALKVMCFSMSFGQTLTHVLVRWFPNDVELTSTDSHSVFCSNLSQHLGPALEGTGAL